MKRVEEGRIATEVLKHANETCGEVRTVRPGSESMKIFVTGTEGYIGARLAPMLIARGHEVIGLDAGLYRDGCLYLDAVGMPVAPKWRYMSRERPIAVVAVPV